MITCLQDLFSHIVKLQQKFPDLKENKYGTIHGALFQFNLLNLKEDDRDHQEAMIIYFDENLEKIKSEDEDFVAKTIWIDRKSQLVCDPPEWFIERKERMGKLQEKIHQEYDPLANAKNELKWKPN